MLTFLGFLLLWFVLGFAGVGLFLFIERPKTQQDVKEILPFVFGGAILFLCVILFSILEVTMRLTKRFSPQTDRLSMWIYEIFKEKK